jgi:hypothetical protein
LHKKHLTTLKFSYQQNLLLSVKTNRKLGRNPQKTHVTQPSFPHHNKRLPSDSAPVFQNATNGGIAAKKQ